jgi:putative flavoprotein involved in K+ transport
MEWWWVRRFFVHVLFRVVFHHLLTVKTPLGRAARAKMLTVGGPRIRQKRRDLVRAGVEWIARTTGAQDGRPVLADGRTLDVKNVIWCTGFDPGLSWIDLPIFEESGEPRHRSGLVEHEPGLYFVGQHFQHAFSSTMIHGVSRDAARMVGVIAARRAEGRASAGKRVLAPSTAG